MDKAEVKIQPKDKVEMKKVENELEILTFNDLSLNECDDVVEGDIEDIISLGEKLVSRCAQLGGAGLAAAQVGYNKKMFVWLFKEGLFQVALNPKYFNAGSKKINTVEACFSYPNQRYFIEGRYKYIQAVYYTFNRKTGKLIKVTKKLRGDSAIAFQHEADHCYGITIATKGKLIPEANQSELQPLDKTETK